MNNCILRLPRIVLASLLFASSVSSFAQDPLVVMFGPVKDQTSKTALSEFTVTATEQKTMTQVPAILRADGRYEINIMQEGDYTVEFNAPGHVAKRMQLELRGPNTEQWKGGYGLNTDISLFREVEVLDLTLGGKPFGICRYDKAANNFAWDRDYTDAQRDRIADLMKEYERRVPSAR